MDTTAIKQLFALIWKYSPLVNEQGVRNAVNDIAKFIQSPQSYAIIPWEEYEAYQKYKKLPKKTSK